ncbi:MAG: hypothetical protein ACE5FJ_05360, partial [Gemmatimonadales bacterium]
MNKAMQMSDFFGMEASEYLEKLDTLVSQAQPPDTGEFSRLTRALRGSAMMANQETIARVASGLEAIAKGLHSGDVQWDESIKQLSIRAVDDIKIFVRSLAEWTDPIERKAISLAGELEQVAGVEVSHTASASDGGGLDTGTRAFVAREGAAAAAALESAAGVVGDTAPDTSVAESILQTMQPLRGVASLADLPPMPDILDAVERMLGEFQRHPDLKVADLPKVLRSAARALAAAAKEVAAAGTTEGSQEAALEFANLMRTAFESEDTL